MNTTFGKLLRTLTKMLSTTFMIYVKVAKATSVQNSPKNCRLAYWRRLMTSSQWPQGCDKVSE